MKRLYPFVILAALLFCSFHIDIVKMRIKAADRLTADTLILPDAYKNWHFLSAPDAGSSDPSSIPGNILRYTASSPSGSEIATLKAIIKGNKAAVEQKLAGATVYKGQVLPESSINGSDLVAGLIAEKGKVIDMEIRDDAIYAVPDGQIDTVALKSALQTVSADDRKKLFYIASATVSIISYKVHATDNVVDKVKEKTDKMDKKLIDLGKNDTAKNGVYLKVKQPKSKTPPPPFSSSNTKTFTEKTVSVQLIPVDDIINATGKK